MRDDYFILKAYLDLWGVSSARTEHDQHVIQGLEMEIISEQSAHTGHCPLKLLLVLSSHRPRRGELLHVLDRDWPHVTQMLKYKLSFELK